MTSVTTMMTMMMYKFPVLFVRPNLFKNIKNDLLFFSPIVTYYKSSHNGILSPKQHDYNTFVIITIKHAIILQGK